MNERKAVRTVAVVGAGAMGAPMARRLLEAGFGVTVCDRSPSALAPLAGAGARVADKAADCAGCDLVIVIVATPQQAEQVLLGEAGLHQGFVAGHLPLVAMMGTMAPETMQRLDGEMRGVGVPLIDAPVSGGPLRAAQGTLTIMTGGDADLIARAQPVFAHIGSHQFHCGPVGAAQTVKLLNNIVGIANSMVAAEAYRLAIEHGLDPAQVARVFEQSSGRNFLSADPEGPAASYAAMTRSREGFDGLVAVMRKDIALAGALAAQRPGRYPSLDALQALLQHVGDESWENWRQVGLANSAAEH